MMRMMFADIRNFSREQLYELYGADISATGEDSTYKESCARFHWILNVYSKDRDEIQPYIDWIQIAFMDKDNLDDDELWKMEMRNILPRQFIEKIEHTGFSQVPRGAVMDETPLKRDAKEKKTFSIFAKD